MLVGESTDFETARNETVLGIRLARHQGIAEILRRKGLAVIGEKMSDNLVIYLFSHLVPLFSGALQLSSNRHREQGVPGLCR